MAELTESISDIEQELDEEQAVYEEETNSVYADEADGEYRTQGTSYESMDVDGEGGDALDVDNSGGEMDGFDGMDGW